MTGMNSDEEAASFFSASAEENTMALSVWPPAARSSASNRHERNARASAFESADSTSGEAGGFLIHDIIFFLCLSIESAKISFESSGSVTEAQLCQYSSRVWTPSWDMLICFAIHPWAGMDCSSHCSRSLAS